MRLTVAKAEEYLAWAAGLNPGPWVDHSRAVARAARIIAERCGVDPDLGYAYGLIHDLGRYKGVTQLRHVLDGFTLLTRDGYPEAAQICLTHSYPIQNPGCYSGTDDCDEAERDVLLRALAAAVYTDYERLIQLADSIALPSGVVLMEKRLVDIAMRHGLNPMALEKWKSLFGIFDDFSKRAGQPLYAFFPEAVANTFGAMSG